MICKAFTVEGFFKVGFIDPGAEINARYYIHKVLKPFLKGYPHKDVLFHQDSTSAHRVKETLEFLHKINN